MHSPNDIRLADGETLLLQTPAALKRLLRKEVPGSFTLTSLGQYQWQAQEPSSNIMQASIGSMDDVYQVVLKKAVVRLDSMALRLSNKGEAERLYLEAHAFLRHRIVAGRSPFFAERVYIGGLFRKAHGWVILTHDRFYWRLDTFGGAESPWQFVDDVSMASHRTVVVTMGTRTYKLRFHSENDAIKCFNLMNGRIR